MVKQRKGFNWRARQQPESSTQTSTPVPQQVKVELNIKQNTGYEDSNILVLPATSKKKKKISEPKPTKRLTKKQRKKLEKIIEHKDKKVQRASLLESLAANQASQEELSQLVGVAEMQTGTLKRKLYNAPEKDVKVNVISGSNKKKQRLMEEDASDSEESIHTSDMSSDEEEACNDTHGQEKTTENNDSDETKVRQSDPDRVTAKQESSVTDKVKERTEVKKDKDDRLKDVDAGKAVQHRKVVHVPVKRTETIQDGRLKLPILGEEQIIMEGIHENLVVIICGETGSGKTTQVPQFLYEAGYAHGEGIIGVTEPRRVAAISMANRVATEMSLTSREVSYQIRYEGNVTPNTKIKFVTDGVLLKEVQKDFLLTKYSVVIIDEAHERSMYTDILIGLLSRIVPLRQKRGNPLKLIIMSATLRVEDFTENRRLFKTVPPVIKVDSRQFPVTIHYNKRTPLDGYLNEAYKKTCKIHRMLPEGGILLFVTGQQEVHTLCKKLRQTFPRDENKDAQPQKKSKKRKRSASKKDKPKIELPNISLDSYSVAPVDEEAVREGNTSDLDLSDEDDLGAVKVGEDQEEEDIEVVGGASSQPLYVLPLYSMLSSEKQAKVFGPVPEGCRLCVVATNVAETSLTIPNIKYVVDTGKVKTKFYDKVTGVSTFRVTWTSKAGANQRAGRAGRVGPGHCYRLYSSAVFNDDFEKFSAAEITRRPVDDLVLQMKDMNIDKVINFPYPTPPDQEQIKAAESLLLNLGAVKKTTPSKPAKRLKKGEKLDIQTTISSLGRAMACFPVSPRYAKMLALGHQQNLLPYVVAIVSALSVQELFAELHFESTDDQQSEELKQKLVYMNGIKRRWAGEGHTLLLGDLTVMLKAVGACEYAGASQQFCDDHGIRYKAMREVRKLRIQLTNTVNTVIPEANICVDPKMKPPDDVQAKLLRQIVLAGMGDHVARKLPDLPSTDKSDKKLKHAYQCMDLEDPVFIHPTSVLYRQRPEFVIYQSIQETSRLYMKGLVAIEQEWLPVFTAGYANMSKPLEDPPPDYDEEKGQVTCMMRGTFGPCSWPLPAVRMEYPESLEKMKWFARFLLEGRVVKALKKFHGDLLSAPATMVKTWAKLQPRTEVLLNALLKERVDSKDTLLKVLKKQPNYLLPALKQWYPQSKHEDLTQIWPPR